MKLIESDCIEAMAAMDAASVDAIICDPPYGLSREPDIADVLTHWLAGDDYEHRGGGFMGKTWDSFVPGPAYWREAIRVLKPGGHLLAFGGTRTYDLLAIAVRIAGFEIRDSVMWLYGSGFPKSLDVSKAIDKATGSKTSELATFIRRHREAAGLSRQDAAERVFGSRTGAFWNWEEGMPQGKHHGPDPALWPRIKAAINAPDSPWDGRLAAAERAVLQERTMVQGGGSALHLREGEHRTVRADVTAPATVEAERWAGWGTALKPGHEPIVVARKPLIGTVAANVLEHGTGALNIDGCRIDAGGGRPARVTDAKESANGSVYAGRQKAGTGFDGGSRAVGETTQGRWPANLILSHAEDCVCVGERKVGRTEGYAEEDGLKTVEAWECAPGCPVAALDAQSGERGAAGAASGPTLTGHSESVARGRFNGVEATPFYGDSGGASRFFYCGKTSKAERNAGLEHFAERPQSIGDGSGSRPPTCNPHPTVKPIALMRWLVKLVTPPGGIVLDPFMGSGSTGIAAALEGFDFIGIEREPEYMPIARERIAWWAEHPRAADADKPIKRQAASVGQGGLF